VETQAQMDFLKSQNCDEIQGFLISRPVEAAAFAELLRAQRDHPLD
jgi:EAL domain-containing protein (putative c-di-GMP-specific phosphodiesterase class I)